MRGSRPAPLHASLRKTEPYLALRPFVQKLFKRFRRHRTLEQITLSGVAADLAHHVQFALLLNAFCNGVKL